MRAIALLLALLGIVLLLRAFLRQSPQGQVRVIVTLAGLAAVLLAAAGRLPWILGLVGAALPLLIGLRGARNQAGRQNGNATSGGQSVVETEFLRMTLDHDSGEMLGEVLAGRFAGQALDALSQGQLLTLLDDYEGQDNESVALLRAYLDRTFGTDWQDAATDSTGTGGLSGDMSREQAFAILGLEEGASEAEILEAHGRLIQRLHPDRGGSTFLAAKINQARDLLLGQ